MSFGLGPQEIVILLAGAACLGAVVVGVVVLVVSLSTDRKEKRDE